MGIFMTKKIIKTLVLIGIFFFGAPALAVAVSLNGVNVDGITSQRFENCTVVVDEFGNINIVAKGYEATRDEGEREAARAKMKPAVSGGKLSRQYWVISEKPAVGKAEYELRLFVNTKWVRTFFPAEAGVYFELTRYLKPGRNNIRIEAEKKISAKGRASASPKHYVRLVFGEGHLEGPSVVVTRTLLDYRRTALETKDFETSKVLVIK